MRQVIPFTKNIEFNTMIGEITNITLEHDLALRDEYSVNGDFIITGKYKINATSPQEEDFSYKIPIDITIDKKYRTDEIELEIDDFRYSQVDSNKLKVDIDLSIDHLEKKDEELENSEVVEERPTIEDEIDTILFNEEVLPNSERTILSDDEKQEIEEIITSDGTQDLFKEVPIEQELVVKEEVKAEPEEEAVAEEKAQITNNSVGSLFTAFKDTEETFSTYSVYIIRNGDNIDDIISKYKTTREALEEYNDMSNIKIGTKLIIPNVINENDK